jgi:protein TonB
MAYRISAGSGPRRVIALVLMAVIMVGFVYGLNSGLGMKVTSMLHDVEAKVIKEPPPPPKETPPPPPPEMKQPPPFVPPPEINVATTAPSPTAITQTTTKPPPPDQPARYYSSNRYPDYPSSAKQKCEFGTVTVMLTIGTNGRVKNVEITHSSGYPDLDQAAVRAAQRWRFAPARRSGQKVETRQPYAIKFDLRNEVGRSFSKRELDQCLKNR